MKYVSLSSRRYICVLSLFLGACAGGTTHYEYKTYIPPETGPKATLVNELEPVLQKNDRASLTIGLDSCAALHDSNGKKDKVYHYGNLFEMKAGDYQTGKEIQVPTDGPIFIFYSSSSRRSSGDAMCSVVFGGQLEEGRRYKVIGGASVIKTNALLFSEKLGCSLGVIDAETLQPVKRISKLCQD